MGYYHCRGYGNSYGGGYGGSWRGSRNGGNRDRGRGEYTVCQNVQCQHWWWKSRNNAECPKCHLSTKAQPLALAWPGGTNVGNRNHNYSPDVAAAAALGSVIPQLLDILKKTSGDAGPAV